jgi:hypothetical protein
MTDDADALLRQADTKDGKTARDRGYSHGEIPGHGRRGAVQLTDWQNVATPADRLDSGPGELAPDELDELRRSEGILSDERAVGDATHGQAHAKPLDPRSWMNGWSPEQQASYFATQRHNGVWNDQAWRRYIERKKQGLPDPIPCAFCRDVFQPERHRKGPSYCSNRCRQAADRARRNAKGRVA